MALRSTALTAALLLGTACASPPGAAQDARLLEASRQHVLVVVDAPRSTTGTLHRFERAEAGWTMVGEPVPVVVGAQGVVKEREGDGRAPQGVFSLGPAFGYRSAPPVGTTIPWQPMLPSTVCVDDSSSLHYNQVVHGDSVEVDWSSSESMRRDLAHGDGLYELGIMVGYNAENTPGRGSCIFLHVWRGPDSPTAGCTAMPEEEMRSLLAWLRPEREPILVQGTRAHVEGLRSDGLLPYPVPEEP